MKKLDIFYFITISFCVVASIYVLYWWDRNYTSEIDMLKNRVQAIEDWIIVLHTENMETENGIRAINSRIDIYGDNIDDIEMSLYKYLMAKYWCKAGMEYSERVMLIDDVVYQWDWVYSIWYYPLTWWEKEYEYTTKKIKVWSIVCK